MEKKQIITYSSIITALVITLGALWALIITTVNNDTNSNINLNGYKLYVNGVELSN